MNFFRFVVGSKKGEFTEKPGLDYLIKLYNIQVENRHQVMDDVKALAELIQKSLKEITEDSVGYLLDYLTSVNLIQNSVITVKFDTTVTKTQLFNNSVSI